MRNPTVISSQEILRVRKFSIVREAFQLPDGSTIEREHIRHPGATVTIPLDRDGNVILMRQFRYALQQIIWEFPAGTLDPAEPPESSAKRELKEETGYSAGSWQLLGSLYSAPGICNEILTCFLASDLTAGTAAREPGELIEIERKSSQEVSSMIREGIMIDAKSIVAFHHATSRGFLTV